MFDAQIQMSAVTAQIRLESPRRGVRKGTLGHYVHGRRLRGHDAQHYGSAVAALQAAQISEQWGDLGSKVLIDSVQTDRPVETSSGLRLATLA
jgi:hypothetical protein